MHEMNVKRKNDIKQVTGIPVHKESILTCSRLSICTWSQLDQLHRQLSSMEHNRDTSVWAGFKEALP